MSLGLLSVVTLIYVGIAVTETVTGRYGIAVVFAGYALANVGLICQIL